MSRVFRMISSNATKKAARRAKLAANKATRNAAGVNMFTQLNGVSPPVRVKSFEINSSPLGEEAYYGTTPLRPANMITGTSFRGILSPEERKQLHMLGLPTQFRDGLTPEEQATANAIAAENMANIRSTKSASTSNGWGVTGRRYVYPKTYYDDLETQAHRPIVLARTRQLEAANALEAQANTLKAFTENSEGADDLLKQAAEIRAREGYTVSEPTPQSVRNAERYHQFAEQIHAKQIKPERPGIFASCFGGSCAAVEPFRPPSITIRNPLTRVAGSYGGHSRKHRRKMRKSRNRRRSYKSKH